MQLAQMAKNVNGGGYAYPLIVKLTEPLTRENNKAI